MNRRNALKAAIAGLAGCLMPMPKAPALALPLPAIGSPWPCRWDGMIQVRRAYAVIVPGMHNGHRTVEWRMVEYTTLVDPKAFKQRNVDLKA